jgi:tRNA1(Val) A37 N6-methylase TrmN6
MTVRKRSVSLDPDAAEYLTRRAKTLKRSVSAVLSEIVAEAAQMEARDRALAELGANVEISERDVERWLRKLGAA